LNLGKLVRDPELLPLLAKRVAVAQQADRSARADFLLRRGNALVADSSKTELGALSGAKVDPSNRVRRRCAPLLLRTAQLDVSASISPGSVTCPSATFRRRRPPHVGRRPADGHGADAVVAAATREQEGNRAGMSG
jgi:hypothetical protein